MYPFTSTRTVYLSKHSHSVCYHIRINLNLQIQLRRRKLTFFLNHCLLYSRKLRKGTNTCVWEWWDFRRRLFIISPSTVMETSDRRSTWNPLPSLKKSWLHLRDLEHVSRTKDKRSHGAKRKHSMVTALHSLLDSGVIHLWPGGIMQRRQVRAVTMAHSYWKSGSFCKGTPTCWP